MKACHLVPVSAALAVLLFAASADAFIGRPLPRNRAGLSVVAASSRSPSSPGGKPPAPQGGSKARPTPIDYRGGTGEKGEDMLVTAEDYFATKPEPFTPALFVGALVPILAILGWWLSTDHPQYTPPPPPAYKVQYEMDMGDT